MAAQEQEYDVIIVGSGAGGGMATHRLANAGLSVALVEAGAYYDPAAEAQRTQLRWPWESPRRGASTRRRPFGDYNACIGGWELDGEPYTMKGDTDFMWWRGRMLGGRTNHWGRISLRFGPLDFKRRDSDGLGDNWPIGYEDVKPYYDKVDKLIGVYGSNEGLYNDPDGFFLPAPETGDCMNCTISTAPLNWAAGDSRTQIHSHQTYQPTARRVFLLRSMQPRLWHPRRLLIRHRSHPSALQGGQVDLYTNAMVREVTTGAEGLATGVSYINTEDHREYELRGRSVVLAASACSSARILLNSRSSRHDKGLGNSSDHVGRYLHDSTGASRAAFVPELMNREIYNEDGVGGMHVYSPWWLENENLDFTRGYHLEIGGGMGMPGYGFGFAVNQYNQFLGERVGGYGNGLRDDIRRFYGSRLSIACRGESIPQFNNRCELDPEVVDQWGIPVLRFDYHWTGHEINQARHMQDTMEALLEASGGIPLGNKPGADEDYGLTKPGEIIHEVGTTRMGDDPATSVTNRFGQLHDAGNVFVADAGTFVSQADKNPPGLSWRWPGGNRTTSSNRCGREIFRDR